MSKPFLLIIMGKNHHGEKTYHQLVASGYDVAYECTYSEAMNRLGIHKKFHAVIIGNSDANERPDNRTIVPYVAAHYVAPIIIGVSELDEIPGCTHMVSATGDVPKNIVDAVSKLIPTR